MTEDALRACCCCWSWPGVGVVGLSAPGLALVVESASGPRIAGGAGDAEVEVEVGRERVEERRESAAEARRETAGEGGAGRDEVSELREDLRPVGSVGVVEVEGGEDG